MADFVKNKDKFNYQLSDIRLKQIGKAIAIARKKRGYTQTELAEKVGTRQNHIANFEAGKQNIAIKTFIAILGCLDMHLDLSSKETCDSFSG